MTTINLYKTYSFKDKDPVIDQLRTIIEDEGAHWDDIEEASGVSRSTLYGWFLGATKRPQYATVMAVARSLGYDFQLVRSNSLKRKR